MRPGESPPRADAGQGLREEVVELARSLPGDLRRLVVHSGDRAIEVEWAPAAAPATAAPAPAAAVAVPPDPPTVPAGDPEVPEGLIAVRAPLVGTFYLAPSPDADPFVEEGDEVEPGQTLGIVEAMKLMNPVVAEEAGVVAEVRAGDAESVEYGQVLVLLRPAGELR